MRDEKCKDMGRRGGSSFPNTWYDRWLVEEGQSSRRASPPLPPTHPHTWYDRLRAERSVRT